MPPSQATTTETLCWVSKKNCLEDLRYFSLSSRDRYHSVVRASPSLKEVAAFQFRTSAAFRGSANQSLTSHLRLDMDRKEGGEGILKISPAALAASAMVVFFPLPM